MKKQSVSTYESGSNSRPSIEPKLSSYAAQAEILLSRTIDLEGIALDGFGYTVTITAGDPSAKNRKSRKSPRDLEMGRMAWPMNRNVSRSGFVDHGLKMGAIEIVERKSLELTESFEEVGQHRTTRGWDRFVL